MVIVHVGQGGRGFRVGILVIRASNLNIYIPFHDSTSFQITSFLISIDSIATTATLNSLYLMHRFIHNAYNLANRRIKMKTRN